MDSGIHQFAGNLKLIRKGRGLTQTQLAEKLGVTKQSIINYEKGANFPTGKRLNDLIKILDVSPEQLLTREFLQLEEEKELIDLCHQISDLQFSYNINREQNLDESIERNMLFEYFNNMDNSELYQALTAYYNVKIERVKRKYISKIVNTY